MRTLAAALRREVGGEVIAKGASRSARGTADNAERQ